MNIYQELTWPWGSAVPSVAVPGPVAAPSWRPPGTKHGLLDVTPEGAGGAGTASVDLGCAVPTPSVGRVSGSLSR